MEAVLTEEAKCKRCGEGHGYKLKVDGSIERKYYCKECQIELADEEYLDRGSEQRVHESIDRACDKVSMAWSGTDEHWGQLR